MKKLSTVLLFISLTAFAEAEKIRPGLWQMVTKIKGADGKEVNMLKSMVDKVNAAKPGQKEEFERALKALHIVNLDTEPANQVCFTEKQLDKLKEIAGKAVNNKECETSDVVDSGNEIRASVKCKDGSTGTISLKYSDSSFENTVDMTTAKKVNTVMSSKAVFLSSDCGQVRPQE